jgi:hypothetical protein
MHHHPMGHQQPTQTTVITVAFDIAGSVVGPGRAGEVAT